MGDFVYARRENRLAIGLAEAVDSNVIFFVVGGG